MKIGKQMHDIKSNDISRNESSNVRKELSSLRMSGCMLTQR